MSNYLLEIGVEEFPAKHINPTKKQFKTGFEKILQENNFIVENIKLSSTPRRFTIYLEGIEANVDNLEETVKGPAKKIAFDQDGNPSKALQGFMNSKGISLEDISYQDVNGEDYVYATIKKETKNIGDLLVDEVPKIIRNISNPRQMKWGGKNLRFLRPIRWIVSLLDDKILEFDLEGIKVSNISKGHRTLGSKEIVIDKIENYERLLEENFVIASEEKRRKIIIRGINRLAKEIGGHFIEDEDLLEEIVYINEYPTPFIGEFDKEYLSLPKELIITPMKDHQRYFPIADDNDKLLPYFIGVRNGDGKSIDVVAEGNRKVLVARLEDAKFFYENDNKKSLEEYVEKLDNVGFYEGLGSMLDKTKRLEKFVETIGEDIETGNDVISISKRAAYLSKADLVTQTVIEFTELQGIMGRIFALNSGENNLVATAIEEQYMPTKSGGELPSTIAGRVLSIADKLDTIAGLYSQGIEVTGSQDLYGQRRAVLGVLNILVDNKINMNLRKMIKEALYNYVDMFGENFDFNEVNSKIEAFVRVRFKNLMNDHGYRYDIIDSVIDQKDLNIRNMYHKVKRLDNLMKDNPDFEGDISKYVRIVNISDKAENSEINEEYLLEEDKAIYSNLSMLDDIEVLINEAKVESAVESLRPLVASMDEYLDNTHVNVEDENVRNNRLAMVKKLADAILIIFDPRKIVR